MDLQLSADILQWPIWQYYMAVAVLMAPVIRIFMRAGMHPLWSFLLFIPVVGYIACAMALALRKWPVLRKTPETKEGALQP